MPSLAGSFKHVFRRTACYAETSDFVESISDKSDESTENLTSPSNSSSEGDEQLQVVSQVRGRRRTKPKDSSRVRSRSSSRTKVALGRLLRRTESDTDLMTRDEDDSNLLQLHYTEQWLPFTDQEETEQSMVEIHTPEPPESLQIQTPLTDQKRIASPTRHPNTNRRPIRNHLHKGVLAVQNAGIRTVNGAYRCTSINDSVGVYTKEGFWNEERVTFSIFRCQHKDMTRRWYVSIVADGYPPGTKHDTDLYSAMSTVSGQSSCLVDETPPDCGWRAVVGSGLPGLALDSPPLCLWIPEESESEVEDVTEEGDGETQHISRRKVMQCVACLERPVSYVFVPCGHPAVCGSCAMVWGNPLPNGESRCCPICRSKVGAVMRFYGTVVEDICKTTNDFKGTESNEVTDHFALE